VTEGFDDHTTAKAGEKMHTSDKSGIIDSMSDDVSQSKSTEADVVGEPGLALARSQAKLAEMAGQHGDSPQSGRRVVFGLENVSVSYSGTVAIRDVAFDIHENLATAFIGPSGCGKTTLLRSMNRMNDLIQGAEVAGRITYHGQDLFGAGVDAVEVRRRIGMVFQRPNPFPKSIYDNVAFGLRIHGMKDNLSDRVEQALRHAALWDEVKDRLKHSALSLSGGQQQRLCIARALAIEPDVILMDEPASALDPVATLAIEDLVGVLKNDYTIVIVTHNMQQAARVADMTAFFSVDADEKTGNRSGVLVESGPTSDLFIRPSDPRTEAYVTGRFG
jgi:phosphate transport system ATP-binding protein